ncbi:MAG: hypothetical protein ACOX87_13615 [Chloroflexota bacterium]|jgi:hypothetical protein
MKLYVDVNGDRHYLVTDDGEAVYVDELQEDGRDTELLEQTIDAARQKRRAKAQRIIDSLKKKSLSYD